MFLNIACVNRSHKKNNRLITRNGPSGKRVKNREAVKHCRRRFSSKVWTWMLEQWHKMTQGTGNCNNAHVSLSRQEFRLAFECTATVVNQNNSPGSTKQSSKLQHWTSGRSWTLSYRSPTRNLSFPIRKTWDCGIISEMRSARALKPDPNSGGPRWAKVKQHSRASLTRDCTEWYTQSYGNFNEEHDDTPLDFLSISFKRQFLTHSGYSISARIFGSSMFIHVYSVFSILFSHK